MNEKVSIPREHKEMYLKIRADERFLGKGLVVPRMPEGRSFIEQENVFLDKDEAAKVFLDLSTKVRVMESGQGRSEGN